MIQNTGIYFMFSQTNSTLHELSWHCGCETIFKVTNPLGANSLAWLASCEQEVFVQIWLHFLPVEYWKDWKLHTFALYKYLKWQDSLTQIYVGIAVVYFAWNCVNLPEFDNNSGLNVKALRVRCHLPNCYKSFKIVSEIGHSCSYSYNRRLRTKILK